MGFEDRLDIPSEIHRPLRWRRERRVVQQWRQEKHGNKEVHASTSLITLP
jgi:hypothetical protein